MCLAVIAYQRSARWPLVIATNRDEFHSRQASPVARWTDHPTIIAGRDLTGGGTWMGVNTAGKIALLTNYREPGRNIPDAPSRGQLTEAFLLAEDSAQSYVRSLEDRMNHYNGFNLLIGDARELWYVSNRSTLSPQKLTPGVFGLSNAELQTPWPKLIKTRQAVAAHLESIDVTDADPDPEILFKVMNDRQTPSDDELPCTGIGIERERMLGSPFITSSAYGTRCTTVAMFHTDGTMMLYERSFDPEGDATGTVKWRTTHAEK